MHVWVVDDSPVTRVALRGMLENEGFTVTEANDGDQIIGAAGHAEADLVLCDMLMPRCNGLQVIRELRREMPRVKIIAMSGGGSNGSADMLQTARYLGALRNPDIQILGHPRGRIYNYRLGLTADWPRVFAEAAWLDKALEIDCYPDRQDLNLSLLKIARREGVRISLGTDAHHPWQLEFIDLGLAAALRAKIPRERIVNFMSILQLKQWVASVRARTAQGRV